MYLKSNLNLPRLFPFLVILLIFSNAPVYGQVQEGPDEVSPEVSQKSEEEKISSPEHVLSQQQNHSSPYDRSPVEIEAAQKVREQNLNIYLIKMLISLFFICLLAWLVLKYILPKMVGFNPKGNDWIKVISRVPLEPRKTLVVIQIGSEFHLLGLGEQSVNYLIPLDEKILQSYETDKSGKSKSSFSEFLKRKIS